MNKEVYEGFKISIFKADYKNRINLLVIYCKYYAFCFLYFVCDMKVGNGQLSLKQFCNVDLRSIIENNSTIFFLDKTLQIFKPLKKWLSNYEWVEFISSQQLRKLEIKHKKCRHF